MRVKRIAFHLLLSFLIWMVFFINDVVSTEANDSPKNIILQWQKIYGINEWNWAESVQQTMDGGYIIVGSTNSFGNDSRDVYLIKTDAYGNVEWVKTYGGNHLDIAYAVQQTTDGGYIIAGATQSFGNGSRDVYLIKIDAYGNVEWQKTFGGSEIDDGYAIQQTLDGGYIIAGWIFSVESNK